MAADDQAAVDRAIEVGKSLLVRRSMTLEYQHMLVRRFTRLINGLSMSDNLLVRRALGFPLDCGTHTCGECDECWYNMMAEKIVQESIDNGEHTDFSVETLREIARRIVRESHDKMIVGKDAENVAEATAHTA